MVTLQTAPQGDCGCKKKEPVMKKTDLRYPKDVWCFLLSWGEWLVFALQTAPPVLTLFCIHTPGINS